jgi:hypothetical protein
LRTVEKKQGIKRFRQVAEADRFSDVVLRRAVGSLVVAFAD